MAAGPAHYRVTILPTALEVSARLATGEELRGLIKLLRASAVIWGKTETKDVVSGRHTKSPRKTFSR